MKKTTFYSILYAVMFVAIFATGNIKVSAQSWDDYTPAYNGNTDYVSTSCTGCDVGSSYSYTPSWNDYTPAYNGNTDYVTTSCVGCGTGYSYTPDTSYSYTPDTGYSYNSYDSGYTYTPSYDNGYTYTPDTGYSYSTPSYGTGYGYTTSGYSTGYTYPSTSWTGYTYPGVTYTTGSTVVTPVVPITCPAGTVLTNGTCTALVSPCPAGFSRLPNGSCGCPAGTQPASPDGCLPITVTPTTCPAGTVLTNGVCQSTYVPPVVTTTNCPSNTTYINGYCQQIINPPTVVYQTCWDGTVIPTTSVCASQYKTCPNGTSVPVSQICYGNSYVPYVAPPVVVFNNVVTSPATSITTTSARCNGIGLIAQRAPSTGWFEYGQTANLGRVTSATSIGSSQTAPFSNLLTSLQANTTYYCRAVMQNQYGTVKGEIVKFTTKSKAVAYVAPVKAVAKTTKTTVKKNEIICSDGSVISVGNQTTATMLSQGQKLVALQMDKVSGDLSSGATVTYRLSYKNLSNSLLSGLVLQITIPQEITFTSTTAGMYDATTHMLTLSPNSMNPYAEGTVTWTGVVTKDAPLGKSIVTTAYASYTVPDTQVQDEVTAYTVGSIGQASTTDTNGHVIGSGNNSFLPDTLVEWLALIAIIFIVFILARSIYASYRDERNTNAH